MNLTELELAQRIRDGTAPSPMKFSNMWLVNLRITGTGLAYRTGLKEHVWRDPNLYLNDAFLQRCNGLPVITNHPDKAVLTEQDFTERIVGSVMLPYIRGDEVWAVCRIYIRDIVEQIVKETVSTSPSVVFNNASGNVEVMDGETNFLIEGVPFLLDHIALVTEDHGSLGVWDKDKIPTGVEVSNKGDIDMDEKMLESIVAKVVGDALGGVNKGFETISARMDSLESGIKARADAEEAEKKEAKEKADQEEQKKADAAAEEQKKADEAEAQKKAEEKAKADEAEEEQRKADQAKADEEKAKAEEEEKAKSDSDMTEARVKADSAYVACGKQAPTPFSGEKALDYRKRVLMGMQKHSEKHKDVNIRAIADSATLSVLEEAIYGEARKSIENEMNNTLGQLHQRVRMDEAGRRITEYQGDPNVWLAAFKTPGRRLVKINTPGSMNNHG
ncbi:NUDIX hydrolase [Erwinia sp. OLTSP20]|uniref:NUDIX hydrolase n=1 Tax=unclassified Erwinia TaxID=2622719 RepID=UPI000C58BE1C|nr:MULTISPECIES: NUDIX hydrolase [unclassified Erwinia]PIJ48953.1 NUDIX hydrolase [Erwinia sp. OAMSP11]PIJ74607.1 NUDIX hydrolase [Erwinia sp. OLSSP12]PIJ79638.1 NUDIX hydrolase [Erwinia sp. OLCASP19]PIJ80423.1 NUDIX hydrolase [Erwinia sp. OLMTSP26]PIJ82538.1 NUDIX hydrolase [Erwinia sp. OLMDSP33]